MTNAVQLAQYGAVQNGFKNRIINGGMVIDKRNAGASVTPSSGLFTYITDRFAGYPGTSSSVTYSQSTNAPTGFSYSFKAQRPVSNTTTTTSYISQVIESNNMRDLVGQSATISFWVLAGANYSSGQVAVYLNTGTVADQGIATSIGGWTGYATAVSLLFTPTTTWTKYTATGTIPSNALEMAILFGYATTGTAGADDSFYITGVQLEKGSVATSFDYRPYGTELALCQRYYYKAVTINTVNSSLMSSGAAYTTTNTAQHYCAFPVSMRAAPTASVSSVNLYNSATNVPITAIATQSSSPTQGTLNFTVASGVVTSAFYIPITSTGYIDFSAEL